MRSRILIAAFALFAYAVPSHAYRMSVWVPSWDPSAVQIMQMQAGNVQETNPGWYTIAADGSITNNYKAEDPTMRAALTGTQLVPTIKNYISGKFDGAMVATIVGDPILRERHAENLAQLVIERGLDGIDVDYEAVPATAKSNFTTFIQLLAGKLHASNRLLSVTVHAKTAESTRNGPGAQDWRAIGAVADSVKIMAYDKHWSGSYAGAITPLDWLDQVATYAGITIPTGKAIIGLPFYGFDWLENVGTSVTYAEAMATANRVGAAIGRDVSGEATYTYSGRTVFFQDAAAYRAKVELIKSKHPAIGGFAHWRVGAEDPAIWPVIRQLMTQLPGAAVLPAPKNFTLNGPRQLTVAAGSKGAGTFDYTGINGFNETVTASVKVLDPFGGTALLTTPTVTATAGTSLLVSVPRTTAPGTYRIMVTMSGGGITQEHGMLVKVTAAPPVGRRRSVR